MLHLPSAPLQKDTVILPGMEGLFGVKANHVPVIAQLKPGVVEMHSGGEVEKFFISGGWAYVHPDGITDIQTLEAVTLDQVGSLTSKQQEQRLLARSVFPCWGRLRQGS